MTTLVALNMICCLVLWVVLRGRFGPSQARWARAIEFRPTESMSPEQLFGCLLSGNFALLMRDNFNQLESSLHRVRVNRTLAEHWAIHCPFDFRRVLEARLARMGQMSQLEHGAIAAWHAGHWAQSNEYAALERTCMFMTLRAHIVDEDALRQGHLSVLAWDVQQVAYLLRLGLAVEYVSRRFADSVLDMLRARVRSTYASWQDYSLSALVGLGMRGSLEIFDATEWMQFARTHSVLLDERHSPIRCAAPWQDPSVRPIEVALSSSLETLSATALGGMTSVVIPGGSALEVQPDGALGRRGLDRWL